MDAEIVDVEKVGAARAVERAAGALLAGELVVMPTDTVYGVAAHPGAEGAQERLFAAKNRPRDKPIPLLAATIDDVVAFGAELGPRERALAERFWPGPLTIVLEVKSGRQEGFRIPDHELARDLLRSAGGILRATSANTSGEPDALTAQEAYRALRRHVSVILDAGPVAGGEASSVVRILPNDVEILRESASSRAEILSVIRYVGPGENTQ